MYRPSGSAMRIARARETAERETCSQRRRGMVSLPLQLAGAVYQATTLPRNSTRLPRPSPGREPVLDPEQRDVGDDGQRHRQEDAGHDRGGEEALDADVDDQVPEPAHADQAG